MDRNSSSHTHSSLSATRLRWSKPRKRSDGEMRLLYGYRCVARIDRHRSNYDWIAGHPRLSMPPRLSESPIRTLETAMDEVARYCAEALRTPLPCDYRAPGGRHSEGLRLAGSRLSGKALQRQCARQAGQVLWALLRGTRVAILSVDGCALSHSAGESDPELIEAEAVLAGTVAETLLHGNASSSVVRAALWTVRNRLERSFRLQPQLLPKEQQLQTALRLTNEQIVTELQNPISRLCLQSLATRLEPRGYLLETSVQEALYPYLELE